MSLSKRFQTVSDLEKEGVPVIYGENSYGKPITFIIARSGGANQMYLNRVEALAKPFRRQIQNETVDPKQLAKIVKQAFCEMGLKGWQNVEADWEEPVSIDGDGTPHYRELPFTPENVALLYEKLPALYDDHLDLSSKTAMYLADVRKAEAGNSQRS